MSTKELKPCPFCDSEPKHTVWSNGNYHRAECEECDYCFDYFNSFEQLSEAWNRRAEVSHPSVLQCVICGEDKPHTGTCGSDDPRALCKVSAPSAQPQLVSLPDRVIDVLFQSAGLTTYHPDGDQMDKFHRFAHLVTEEVLARLPQPVASNATPVQPELTVWYGPMPESNGKSNFTAILMRKDGDAWDNMTDGITLDRSEYPDRVRYEADRVRYLIGELAERPELWDKSYDFDKHSGYVEPIPSSQPSEHAKGAA